MTNSENVAGAELRQIIERIERLEGEKSELGKDIKDIYLESKGRGFNPKVIKKIVARRKKGRDELAEEEATLEMYLSAMGE